MKILALFLIAILIFAASPVLACGDSAGEDKDDQSFTIDVQRMCATCGCTKKKAECKPEEEANSDDEAEADDEEEADDREEADDQCGGDKDKEPEAMCSGSGCGKDKDETEA